MEITHPISWSAAVQIALDKGASAKEETMAGCVVGLNINGRIVRHWKGWYEKAKVEEAAGH